MDRIMLDVQHERKRQDAKWGVQDHEPSTWLMILGEEVGDANRAVLESMISGEFNKDLYREEMIQVATVALAAIEAFDRAQVKMELYQRRVIEEKKELDERIKRLDAFFGRAH